MGHCTHTSGDAATQHVHFACILCRRSPRRRDGTATDIAFSPSKYTFCIQDKKKLHVLSDIHPSLMAAECVLCVISQYCVYWFFGCGCDTVRLKITDVRTGPKQACSALRRLYKAFLWEWNTSLGRKTLIWRTPGVWTDSGLAVPLSGGSQFGWCSPWLEGGGG